LRLPFGLSNSPIKTRNNGPLEVFGWIIALVGISFVVSSTTLPPLKRNSMIGDKTTFEIKAA